MSQKYRTLQQADFRVIESRLINAALTFHCVKGVYHSFVRCPFYQNDSVNEYTVVVDADLYTLDIIIDINCNKTCSLLACVLVCKTEIKTLSKK